MIVIVHLQMIVVVHVEDLHLLNVFSVKMIKQLAGIIPVQIQMMIVHQLVKKKGELYALMDHVQSM